MNPYIPPFGVGDVVYRDSRSDFWFVYGSSVQDPVLATSLVRFTVNR